MTQVATIEKLLDADHAEIAVARQSACAHDCAAVSYTHLDVYKRQPLSLPTRVFERSCWKCSGSWPGSTAW